MVYCNRKRRRGGGREEVGELRIGGRRGGCDRWAMALAIDRPLAPRLGLAWPSRVEKERKGKTEKGRDREEKQKKEKIYMKKEN